MLMIIFCLFF